MIYCSKCGTAIEGRFCQTCGAAAVTPISSAAETQAGGLSNNSASALCYLFGFVTGILFLVLPPYNQQATVRFHAFQSIFLSVAMMVLQAAIGVFAGMMSVMSFSLGLLTGSLHLVVSLGFFLVWLYMMWSSYQGERVELPVIGEWAARQSDKEPPGDTMGRAA